MLDDILPKNETNIKKSLPYPGSNRNRTLLPPPVPDENPATSPRLITQPNQTQPSVGQRPVLDPVLPRRIKPPVRIGLEPQLVQDTDSIVAYQVLMVQVQGHHYEPFWRD